MAIVDHATTGSPALDDFVTAIETRRKKAGWTVAKLAEEADVGMPYLYRVLKGEQHPTITWMERVGKALGLTVKVSVK